MKGGTPPALFERVRTIIESARSGIARSVNTAQVAAYWMIGKEIVEEEQKGKRRAEYGKKVLEGLAARLTEQYGRGYSVENLGFIRQLFLRYPDLIAPGQIPYTPCRESWVYERTALSRDTEGKALKAVTKRYTLITWLLGNNGPHQRRLVRGAGELGAYLEALSARVGRPAEGQPGRQEDQGRGVLLSRQPRGGQGPFLLSGQALCRGGVQARERQEAARQVPRPDFKGQEANRIPAAGLA